jgi:hypothetical protein
MIGRLHRRPTRHGGSARRTLAAGASLALVLTLGACGDDDEDAGEAIDDAITAVSDAATDASDALDDAITEATDVADTVADSMEDVAGTIADSIDDAVDDISDDDTTDTTALPDGPPDANPCAAGESGDLGETEAPSDDATAIEVTADEYVFSGLDEITETGEYALTLTNEGEELHEIVMVRIDDDETRPVEELLQEEDPSQFATDVAFAFACPGDSSEPTAVNIDEPGRYVAVCFIPVGVTPDTPPEDFETLGPPHALQGMVAEIQVS